MKILERIVSEFTQLDMEVSFERSKIFILNLVENMMQRVFKNVLDMDYSNTI